MVKYNLSQIKKIILQYAGEMKKRGIDVERIILYGSYAKGSALPYSDIDIVIISKDFKKWPPIERLQMLSRATVNTDAPLEVIGYTPKEIKDAGRDSIFWDEIIKTGFEIYKKAA